MQDGVFQNFTHRPGALILGNFRADKVVAVDFQIGISKRSAVGQHLAINLIDFFGGHRRCRRVALGRFCVRPFQRDYIVDNFKVVDNEHSDFFLACQPVDVVHVRVDKPQNFVHVPVRHFQPVAAENFFGDFLSRFGVHMHIAVLLHRKRFADVVQKPRKT